jgi:thiol-disulfide isomerase/thioredoxin
MIRRLEGSPSMRTRAMALAAVLTSFLLAAPATAQDGPEDIQMLLEQGIDHLQAGNGLLAKAKAATGAEAEKLTAEANAAFDEGCKKYARVLEIIAPLDIDDAQKAEVRALCHYNTACGRSLQGKKEEALTAFAAAVESGFTDWDHIAKDTDLDNIRKEPRFAQIIERQKAAEKEAAAAEAKAQLSPDAMFPYDFKVTTIDGKPLALADLKGKVVIVDFWGTWCPPCREEIPSFIELKKQFGDKLEIVGMTWEHGQGGEEGVAKIKKFCQEFKVEFNYPLTLVTDRAELQKVPDFKAFPTTLFIDKQGRVRAKLVGLTELEGLKSLTQALLDEGAAAGDKPAEKPATPPSGGTPF